MPTKLQQQKPAPLVATMKTEGTSTHKAPLWARVIVIVVEVLVWALSLGFVKCIPVLERALGYSPQWHERDKAEKGIKGALRSGMGAACRLAQPLLRIETEFSQDTGVDSANVLTPRTATAYEETLKTRLQVNARIRSFLHDVSLEELEAPFLVNACTWNVDQQPPPVHEEAFMVWLLGHELTEELKHYQEHKRCVMANGGTVPTVSSPNATSTMRARKMFAAAAGTGNNSTSALQASLSPAVSEDQESNDPLQTEWQWLEGKFPDLLLVSLQEVEMTGTALVRESTQRRWEWTDAIIETLLAASDRAIEYRKLQVVQLVGLVLIVLVQAKHVDYVSHVRLSLTRTGALSMLGNKGSVAMRATIYGKRFLFISAHFVAHTYNEKKRTGNYQSALKDIRFNMPAWSDDESEVLQTFMNAAKASDQTMENSSMIDSSSWDPLFRFRNTAFPPSFSTAAETRVLDDHDYVFFFGDLNSRLHALPGLEIRESVENVEYDYLLCHDELRQVMVSGEAFDGFQEQWITFPPTYKFDRGTDAYDTSRKHRDPAWCDRVLFRVSENREAATLREEGERSNDLDARQGDGRNNGSNGSSPTSRRRSSGSHSSNAGGGAVHSSRAASPGGDWVSLEDLQRSALSQPVEAEVGSLSSSASSEYACDDDDRSKGSLLHSEQRAAAMVAVAAQNGFDSPLSLLHKKAASPTLLSRAASHPVWEHKRTAPTFCAVRRPRGAEPSSNPFAVRFPMVTNHINALEYTHVPALRQSDHRPVRARFEVKVVALEPSTVNEIVESVRQVIDD
ncbi:inositol 5-phosphatase-like protein [Leptomonas pyrrhocoris]|uniref:Inositol 5-phosphatase-like protein n=1 Tax=Leptomonas pyrrhocoris TaxID=157538 RepID=A0A0N0DWT8_LEPPY|nr:inositol 5-phosphatase-like protein [Leptomonas pyrrhocoris]KPA82188.1 inositol 5-phosphatase-like protein [Leptomonas pyrrhocoris]|eukprot:XP_015660627.1 inositol 5-phosphatase-like protein [Leptomonas pyrrhocoris]